MIVRPLPARPGARPGRRLAAAAGTALGSVGTGLGLAEANSTVGRTFVLAFVLVVPAIAIARLLPGLGTPLSLTVATVGAVVINALVAQVMVSTNTWSRSAGVVAVGLVAALVWLVPPSSRDRVAAETTGRAS